MVSQPAYESLVDQLRKALHDGDAVFVIGTGVSASVTRSDAWPRGDPVANWSGLLENGIKRCAGKEPRVGEAFVQRWLPVVQHGGVEELLAAGDVVDAFLREAGQFGPWLDETVGALQVRDATLVEVINSFGLPIMTTNYDNLLETVTNRKSLSILHRHAIDVLRGKKERIVHLHGNCDDDESIVLGWHSYFRFLHDDRAVQRESALGHMKSFVFVGFGAGFRDPHFALLMRQLAHSLENTGYCHFHLLPEGQADEAARLLSRKSAVRVLNYGPIEGLAEFLKTLLPLNSASSNVPVAPPPALDEQGVFYARFVGRAELLTEFRNVVGPLVSSPGAGQRGQGSSDAAATRSPDVPTRIMWLDGISGMGKSTFLRRAAIEAKKRYGADLSVALVDWMAQSERLKPLGDTPLDPALMFLPIAKRLEQHYGREVLQPYFDARSEVSRHEEDHDELKARFDAALKILQSYGRDWEQTWSHAHRSPAIQDAPQESEKKDDVEALQRILERFQSLRGGHDSIQRRALALSAGSTKFDDVLQRWICARKGSHVSEGLHSPVETLARGLSRSLTSACRTRPLVLMLDTCELLPERCVQWLSFVIGELMRQDAALAVVVASDKTAEATLRNPMAWHNKLPPGRLKAIHFDKSLRFSVPEIAEVLAGSPDPGVRALSPQLLHEVTQGFPLVLSVLLDKIAIGLSESELPVLFGTGDDDENPRDFARFASRAITIASEGFLRQLRDDPGLADDFKAIMAIVVQRVLNVPVLERLWKPHDAMERLRELRERYAIFKGNELHETVRQFVRLDWRENPPAGLVEIAREMRAIAAAIRPGEDDGTAYAAWLIEDLNLALWESLDGALPLIPARMAVVLAHNSGIEVLFHLIDELERTPRVPKDVVGTARHILDAYAVVANGMLQIDGLYAEWFEARHAERSEFERASIALVTGLALFDPVSIDRRTYLDVRERLEAAIRYFRGRLPRASEVVRAYGEVVARTSTRESDAGAVQALALLRESGLDGELEPYNRAILMLYGGDIDGGGARWKKAMGPSPTADDYRRLGHIYSDYGDQQRHYEAATEAFELATTMSPNAAQGWLSWAALEVRWGHAERATELCQRGLACSEGSDDYWGLNSIAWMMYRRNERLAEAEGYARTAYERSGGDLHVLHTLTVLELRRGNWASGREHLRELFEAQSSLAPILRWSSIYGMVGSALAAHGSEVIAVLRALENADDWGDFIAAAEAVVRREDAAARGDAIRQHWAALNEAFESSVSPPQPLR